MSTSAPKPPRWIDWKPSTQIITDSSRTEPTKPSKPGSVGFVGSTPEELPNIQMKPDSEAESAHVPERGIPWAEWKAAALNQLFKEQGVTGRPGRITAATVRHGEASHLRKSAGISAVDCAPPDEQPMSPVEPTE
jgi:hypothetical protein